MTFYMALEHKWKAQLEKCPPALSRPTAAKCQKISREADARSGSMRYNVRTHNRPKSTKRHPEIKRLIRVSMVLVDLTQTRSADRMYSFKQLYRCILRISIKIRFRITSNDSECSNYFRGYMNRCRSCKKRWPL